MAQWDNLKGVPKLQQKKYISFVHKKTTALLTGKIRRGKFMQDVRKFRDKIEPQKKYVDLLPLKQKQFDFRYPSFSAVKKNKSLSRYLR